MRRVGLGLASATLWTATVAAEPPALSVEEEVQALKGSEYGPTLPGTRLFEHLSCTLGGSGQMVMRRRPQTGWSDGIAKCGDRFVMMLMRFHRGKTHFENRWRIVDALLLPEVIDLDVDSSGREGNYLYTPAECLLDGTWGTMFYAVVHVGARKRMDWRTGVEGAWGYDLKRQRIVPLSTKRVVCTKPDPD